MKYSDFEKFVAAMKEMQVNAELSIKIRNGKEEICIMGSTADILVSAEELAAKAINFACKGTPLSKKDAYAEFCEGLKGWLKLLEGKE